MTIPVSVNYIFKHCSESQQPYLKSIFNNSLLFEIRIKYMFLLFLDTKVVNLECVSKRHTYIK